MKCNPTVTIDRVIRGNPYVSKNAPAAGMPDSVPPGKTYKVKITISGMDACPGKFIMLSIANSSGDNGTATIAPTKINRTTTVTVTGGAQTKPGHSGQLKIQAKLDGLTKAESLGFTVCAHPVNFTDAFHSDIDEPIKVGVRVQDGWDSDSGSVAQLDEAEITEVVEYDPPTVPPYAPFPAGGPLNSGYLQANAFTVDAHTIGRPTAGPAATWERRQLSLYKCKRCGVIDKVQPKSGLKIIHHVFQDGSGNWQHKTTKTGAAVTIAGNSTGAATANVTSPNHALP